MKEFDEIPSAIEIKEVGEQKVTKQMAQMVAIPGLPVWEYNEETKILIEAEIIETQLQINKDPQRWSPEVGMVLQAPATRHRKVNYKSGHMYFQALNRKNAMRKLANLLK